MSTGLHSDPDFAVPRVDLEKRDDATLILRSPRVLGPDPCAGGPGVILAGPVKTS